MSSSILFICTGNIFRSMTAEYALRAQLGNDSRYHVSSAGTGANPQSMYEPVRERLNALGIDPSAHLQRKLTSDILDAADLPVAMSLDHRAFVAEHFGREIPLFNRICFGRDEALLDVGESMPDWKSRPEDVGPYTVRMVDTIWNAMPHFIANMHRFID